MQTADAGTQRVDHAGHLIARHGGKRRHPLIDALADQGIGLAHADGLGSHANFMGRWLRQRPLGQFKDLGAASAGELYDLDVAHGEGVGYP